MMVICMKVLERAERFNDGKNIADLHSSRLATNSLNTVFKTNQDCLQNFLQDE